MSDYINDLDLNIGNMINKFTNYAKNGLLHADKEEDFSLQEGPNNLVS